MNAVPAEARPVALPLQAENIPAALREQRRWVVWRYTWRQGRWAKKPLTCDGLPASTTASTTWASFDEALAAMPALQADGVGVVLGEGWVGVDLDDCFDELGLTNEVATELLERCGGGYIETSPSGTGLKLIARGGAGLASAAKPGVEVYVGCERGGRYFALTGHVLSPGSGDLSLDLKWFVEKHCSTAALAVNDPFASFRPPLSDWPLDRVVEELLPVLPTELVEDYDGWLRVGMALHHQGEGEEDWLQAWDEWSAGGSKWRTGACAAKWNGFSAQRAAGRGPTTLAWLLSLTKEVRQGRAAEVSRSTLDELTNKVNGSSNVDELKAAVREFKAQTKAMDAIDRGRLAQVVQDRFKAFGVKLPIAQARGMLAPPSSPQEGAGTAPPGLLEEWLYVTDADKFFSRRTKERLTPRGFDARFNRLLTAEQRKVGSASRLSVDDWGMQVVSHLGYLPWAGDVFEHEGLVFANLYRPESVPESVAPTREDDDVLALLEEHLHRMFPDAVVFNAILDWVAHQAQKPGVKVRWSPYVWGVEGCGKTMLAQILRAALGPENVGELTSSVLTSDFTSWATGTAVTVIEEVKLPGHNRHEAANRLKPLITNSEIEIHPKGKDSFKTVNTTNYLLNSNWGDGLPLSNSDRRYMVVEIRLSTEEVAAIRDAGIFKRIFDLVEGRPGVIRHWLLARQLSPGFDPDGAAPWTEDKADAIASDANELEEAIEEILLTGGNPDLSRDFVWMATLRQALKARGLEVHGRACSSGLRRMGLKRVLKVVWHQGVAGRAWVSPSLLTQDLKGWLAERDFQAPAAEPQK